MRRAKEVEEAAKAWRAANPVTPSCSSTDTAAGPGPGPEPEPTTEAKEEARPESEAKARRYPSPFGQAGKPKKGGEKKKTDSGPPGVAQQGIQRVPVEARELCNKMQLLVYGFRGEKDKMDALQKKLQGATGRKVYFKKGGKFFVDQSRAKGQDFVTA